MTAACLRARPRGREHLAHVPPSSSVLRGAGCCACALWASPPLGVLPQLSRERVWAEGGAKLLGTDAVSTAEQGGTILGHVLVPITKLGNSPWQCTAIFQVGMPNIRKESDSSTTPSMLHAGAEPPPGAWSLCGTARCLLGIVVVVVCGRERD